MFEYSRNLAKYKHEPNIQFRCTNDPAPEQQARSTKQDIILIVLVK